MLMDIIFGAINNPNRCEMVARMVAFPEKARAGAPSSVGTIHQCLPCVQEGLSVLYRPKFSLCIGHFAGFELGL